MNSEHEVIADYKQHVAGEREVVNWTRPDGKTYFDVPVLYLREVSKEDYLKQRTIDAADRLAADKSRVYFWEVSVD